MFVFLKQALFEPKFTGAMFSSSDKLAELITDLADLNSADCVVEFGSGTGVFTKRIKDKINPDASFFAIELNSKFAKITRKVCPDVFVFEDSAANVKKYLGQFARTECDRIVSGLPWASFPDGLQSEILNAAFDSLRPGGKFVTFAHYPFSRFPRGKRFKFKLLHLFKEVKLSKIVWTNCPPAFVYVCVK